MGQQWASQGPAMGPAWSPASWPAPPLHLPSTSPPSGNRTSGSRAAISFAATIHQTQDPGSTSRDCEAAAQPKFPSRKLQWVLMRPPSNSTSDSIQCWVEPAADESPGSKGSKRDRHQRQREATKVETKSFTDYGLLALFVTAFAPILVNRILYDVYFLY